MKPTSSLSVTSVPCVGDVVTYETQRLVALGERQGWAAHVLGQAPFPDRSVRVGEWLVAPIHLDTSLIPSRALHRVQAIYEAGLRPKGFVIVHEAPLVLSAPADATPQPSELPSLAPELQALAASVGQVVLGLLGAAAAAGMMAVLGLPMALLLGAAMLDPILVAVMEDGTWVEIDRWWSEPS